MFYEGLHLYQKTGVNTARTLYLRCGIWLIPLGSSNSTLFFTVVNFQDILIYFLLWKLLLNPKENGHLDAPEQFDLKKEYEMFMYISLFIIIIYLFNFCIWYWPGTNLQCGDQREKRVGMWERIGSYISAQDLQCGDQREKRVVMWERTGSYIRPGFTVWRPKRKESCDMREYR